MSVPAFPFYLKPAYGSFYTTQDFHQISRRMDNLDLELKTMEEGTGRWVCENDQVEFEVRIWIKDDHHLVEVWQMNGCRWAFSVLAKTIQQLLA
jgi:hypothetical protein